MPDVAQRLLNFLHQRTRGVEQQGQTERTEHADIHILDERVDVRRDIVAFVAGVLLASLPSGSSVSQRSDESSTYGCSAEIKPDRHRKAHFACYKKLWLCVRC